LKTWVPLVSLLLISTLAPAAEGAGGLDAALARAGDNRAELESALARVPRKQRESLEFLIAHAPEQDLRRLSAGFLLENVAEAHAAWSEAPWRRRVPREIFLNEVLPYASVNEKREDWRAGLRRRFASLVARARTPSEAAVILNREVFLRLGVRYGTGRPKPDQCPSESIEAGLASCTGLSILLIDACRAVGVPARFVGVPLWPDGSGNHSWVEIWDEGWHFTGAAEPTGDRLDEAWFAGRASGCHRDDPRHAVYAVSWRETPLSFPLVWDESIDWVHAVDVTDRYANRAAELPPGHVRLRVRVTDRRSGKRVAAMLALLDASGQVVQQAIAKDERFDANDHAVFVVPEGRWTIQAWEGDRTAERSLRVGGATRLLEIEL
jgi:hypothetical protein